MRSPSTAAIVLGFFAAWFGYNMVSAADWSSWSERDAPAVGTITSLAEYPQRSRDGVTATYTGWTTPDSVTGRVNWNPSREVCVRYAVGGEGCWYVNYGGDWSSLRVGQQMGGEYVLCAPHPAPNADATDANCPAFFDPDGQPVVVRKVRPASPGPRR